MRLHSSFHRPVLIFHGAGVYQTLVIDFVSYDTPGENLVPPTKKRGVKWSCFIFSNKILVLNFISSES